MRNRPKRSREEAQKPIPWKEWLNMHKRHHSKPVEGNRGLRSRNSDSELVYIVYVTRISVIFSRILRVANHQLAHGKTDESRLTSEGKQNNVLTTSQTMLVGVPTELKVDSPVHDNARA